MMWTGNGCLIRYKVKVYRSVYKQLSLVYLGKIDRGLSIVPMHVLHVHIYTLYTVYLVNMAVC